MIAKNILKLFALMAFIIFSVSTQELEFKEVETVQEIQQLQEEHLENPQPEIKRNLQIGGCVREWNFCFYGGPACCSGLTCNFVKQFCIKV
jgi:hypothetical protein